MRVLLTEPVHPEAWAMLRTAGLDVIEAAELSPGEQQEALAEAEIILVRTRALSPDLMAHPLRMISKHGTGTDNIPLAAARAAGITVANTPGANSAAVAEHTLMLILALAKRLPESRAAVAAGRMAADTFPIADLAGRRLLLIGFGQIARRVAVLATAFGMEVTVLSRSLAGAVSKVGRTPEGYRIAPSLAAALPLAEVLSLHCPLTPETRGLIGAAELACLPEGALVVNTARGGLIDEAALAEARHLGGIGLDVTEVEPLPADHPLQNRPDVILTPHAAALSAGAFRQMGVDAAGNILDYLAGRLDPAKTVTAPA